jgi:hypothetical protein
MNLILNLVPEICFPVHFAALQAITMLIAETGNDNLFSNGLKKVA